MYDFFVNGGSDALIVRIASDNGTPDGLPSDESSYETAFNALRKSNLKFNLLCLPPDNAAKDVDVAVLREALNLCVECRAFLILDPRSDWSSPADLLDPNKGLAAMDLHGTDTCNAAIYFPHIQKAPTSANRGISTISVVPCGAIAGVIARTDKRHGVWKAPAGPDSQIKNIDSLSASITDLENDILKSIGVNCLRSFPESGPVVWGARTLCGNDQSIDEYKYIPVRRLALLIEESLFRGTQWAVFEPNDERLWAKIRLTVEAFMHSLFEKGALQGSTSREAYFVKCGAETMTQNDRNLGIVKFLVGFAPTKPAEFFVINMRQCTNQ